jgi:dihydroorotate dehydrogenase (fumarate)
MDLSTTYLGLRLRHPFIVGASPLTDTLDGARRLEDGGAAAIVLRSLFEEQISLAESGRIRQMSPSDETFRALLEPFPPLDRYVLSPDGYLEHIRRVKAAVAVPVIASLNGITAQAWLRFAARLEEAGADALELNVYQVVPSAEEPSVSIERRIRDALSDLVNTLRIPVAVKISPFYTSLANFAGQLDAAGASGLVLFNRFYQPDIDIDTMSSVTSATLSTSAELLLRLRWAAVLRGRVRASLAVGGGVATRVDGIKALLAGADAVQLVSAILRHGPAFFGVMRDGLIRWMESKELSSLADVIGRASLQHSADPGFVERGSYIQILQQTPSDMNK